MADEGLEVSTGGSLDIGSDDYIEPAATPAPQAPAITQTAEGNTSSADPAAGKEEAKEDDPSPPSAISDGKEREKEAGDTSFPGRGRGAGNRRGTGRGGGRRGGPTKAASEEGEGVKAPEDGSKAAEEGDAEAAGAASGTVKPIRAERKTSEGYINPDRVNTGGLAREKLTPDQLAEKMAKIKLQNEKIMQKRELVEKDEAEFAKLAASDKQAREAAMRKAEETRKIQLALDQEREKSRQRKMMGANLQRREWDSEKREEDWMTRDRPYARGSRGGGGGFGGRGGRGGGRGGRGGAASRNEPKSSPSMPQGPGNVDDKAEYPALDSAASGKADDSDKAETEATEAKPAAAGSESEPAAST